MNTIIVVKLSLPRSSEEGVIMCCLEEIGSKNVINVKDGVCLGHICDIELDAADGRILSFIIYGHSRFFGLFGRDEDIIIPWCNIQTIGEDAIIVCIDIPESRRRTKKSCLFNFFNHQ